MLCVRRVLSVYFVFFAFRSMASDGQIQRALSQAKVVFSAKHVSPGRRISPIQMAAQQVGEKEWSEKSLLRVGLQILRATGRTSSVDLRFQKKQESLTGSHFHFDQWVGDHRVENGGLILSVSKKDHRLYQVYDSTLTPPKQFHASNKKVTELRALQKAWDYLSVRGGLLAPPEVRLEWTLVDEKLELTYLIHLSVQVPHGSWQVAVDAHSGEVRTVKNLLLPTKRDSRFSNHPPRTNQKPWNLNETLESFLESQKARMIRHSSLTRAEGRAFVFDPDPRTTLLNNDLQDDSPAEAFEEAYEERKLLDVSFVDGLYHLIGPWVKIVDFEGPTQEPSTTQAGLWDKRRGDNSFNDVMTYYHLDKSQRYLQSLGYQGETGIQMLSIEVDSNAVQGADNSYFNPTTNQLAFGHGCVDDNEDADVILHEYGHAIEHGIVENWGGGDSGAIGEGFGDYWAASYGLTTPHGKTFYPHQIFTFDAHGQGNQCWSGRILNAKAKYESHKNYQAHAPITGGYQSDELWSAPLFGTLKAAMEKGFARELVDKVILEAHFGIGHGVTMPMMAQSIVDTAGELEETGVLASLFLSHFLRHSILELPTPRLVVMDSKIRQEKDASGQLLPEYWLSYSLKNEGTADTGAFEGELFTGTDFSQALGTFKSGTIKVGESVWTAPLKVRLPQSFSCGDEMGSQLEIGFLNPQFEKASLRYHAIMGEPQGSFVEKQVDLEIADNQDEGVSTELVWEGPQTVEPRHFSVGVWIEHPYQGDLRVRLTSPEGTSLFLKNRSGAGKDHVKGFFPDELSPDESFEALYGQKMAGVWKLEVSDHAGGDKGKFTHWQLKNVESYSCEE